MHSTPAPKGAGALTGFQSDRSRLLLEAALIAGPVQGGDVVFTRGEVGLHGLDQDVGVVAELVDDAARLLIGELELVDELGLEAVGVDAIAAAAASGEAEADGGRDGQSRCNTSHGGLHFLGSVCRSIGRP